MEMSGRMVQVKTQLKQKDTEVWTQEGWILSEGVEPASSLGSKLRVTNWCGNGDPTERGAVGQGVGELDAGAVGAGEHPLAH